MGSRFALNYIKGFDMEKCKAEFESNIDTQEVRRLVGYEKCSLHKAAEVLGLELPTVRILVGNYIEDKIMRVAFEIGKTEQELKNDILKKFVSGKNFYEISDEIGITYTATRRFFFSAVRERFKASDFE